MNAVPAEQITIPVAGGLAGCVVETAGLVPDRENARRHDAKNLDAIAESLRRFGQMRPIVLGPDDVVLAGNGTLEAATKRLGWTQIAAVRLGELDENARRAYALVDNRTAELASWSVEALAASLITLRESGWDLRAVGWADDEVAKILNEGAGRGVAESEAVLAEPFTLAPATVLSGREAWWQRRKAAWIGLGLRSELGRGADGAKGKDGLVYSATCQPLDTYRAKEEFERRVGRVVAWAEFIAAHPEAMKFQGTSVFDPVLGEAIYRWWGRPGARVLDPFAGGSVRGVVAGRLGLEYVGIDLSDRQLDSNAEQRDEILDAEAAARVEWILGDSRDVLRGLDVGPVDLVFSCPPYADLEVYSDDPADLSTMPYPDFVAAYREIIAGACERLVDNRFAVFVVGDVRAKDTGEYRGFPSETVAAFEAAGCRLHGAAVLATATGTLAVRTSRPFSASRKLGKAHQNVLVFVKGDARAAAAWAAGGGAEVKG